MVPVAEQRRFLRDFYDIANRRAPDNLVDIHEVGNQCGLDELKSEEIAQLLVDDGILEHEGTFPAYRLTPKGRMAVREAWIGFKGEKTLPPRLLVNMTSIGEQASTQVAPASLGSQDCAAVAGALELVRQSLAEVESVAGYPQQHLLEIVDELDMEIKRPDPNGVRLRGLLLGLAGVIVLGKNNEAVEHAVHVALSFLHIDIIP